MKLILAVLIGVVPTTCLASKAGSGSMQSSTELLEWCEAKTRSHYAGKGITPYNWSASWWEEGNVLFVRGSCRIESEYVTVECHVMRGATKQHAKFKVVDKKRETVGR